MNENDVVRLSEQIDSLRGAVTRLAESIQSSEVMVREARAAARAAETSAASSKKSTGYLRWAVGGLSVLLAAQAFLVFHDRGQSADIDKVRDNTAELQVVQRELDAAQRKLREIQTRTSDQALCPLFGLFVAARNNPVPEVQRTPELLKRREDAFAQIEMIYNDVLGCPSR